MIIYFSHSNLHNAHINSVYTSHEKKLKDKGDSVNYTLQSVNK